MAKFKAPIRVKAAIERQKHEKPQAQDAKATIFSKKLNGGGAQN